MPRKVNDRAISKSASVQVRQALVTNRQEASSDRLGRMATLSIGRSAASYEYREICKCVSMGPVLLSLHCGIDWSVIVRSD